MNPTNTLTEVQYLDKYSRYDYNLGRREKWNETVERVVDFLVKRVPFDYRSEAYEILFKNVLEKRATPAMRLLAVAGPAADKFEESIYNCSFLPLETAQDFHDLTLLLGLGVGVGFSVENDYVKLFGKVNEKTGNTYNFRIEDKIEAWAQSIQFLIEHKMSGNNIIFDYSAIRPTGTPLKTRGGRASGPEPLMDAHKMIGKVIDNRQGQSLRPIDCFDIACHIAGAIVSGGVRRCLPVGSKVHTKTGMKNIESILVGDEVLTSNGYHKVSNTFYQGFQKIVRVRTQDSYFDCTPNHRIAVMTENEKYEWKMASELVFGDKLVSPSFSIEGKIQTLPDFVYSKPKNSTSSIDIKIPELTEEIAWFLGYIHGDGYVYLKNGQGRVSITIPADQIEHGKRVYDCFKLFGLNPKIQEHDNFFDIYVNSKQLAVYFQSFLKKPKETIYVPDFIWNANENIKLAYVSGVMDSDGSEKQEPVEIVKTIYKDFAKDIQLLLSSCGLQTRIKTERGKEGKKASYEVAIINYRCKERFANIPTLFKNNYSFKLKTQGNSYSDGLNWSKTENKLIPVSFVGIEELDEEQETYDIEVENMHEFFCEGYLMHNSAMITIFDLNDEEMLKSKSGEWYENNIQRQYANISSIIDEKMSKKKMYDLIQTMHDSGFGEPGIFSRYALRNTAPDRRNIVFGMGTNPCGEIALRPRQFCNLSQAIIYSTDSEQDIRDKVKVASVIGTIQSSITNFNNIHPDFRKNCEEERLLGVSLSGIMDNIYLQNEEFLIELKDIAIKTNIEWARKMGINPSSSVTCVKPDGNTSVLYNTSPGLHPRWSPYYIRRIRLQFNNPIAQWLIASGVYCEPQTGETWDNVKTVVFDFPIKSPEGIKMFQTSATAVEQLNVWLKMKKNWTEHNPSVTIHYRKEELDDIKSFCVNNQEYLSGVSFLENGHKYNQAPYEEITEEKYKELLKNFPEVNLDDFWQFETTFDSTTGAQSMACVGGSCLI